MISLPFRSVHSFASLVCGVKNFYFGNFTRTMLHRVVSIFAFDIWVSEIKNDAIFFWKTKWKKKLREKHKESFFITKICLSRFSTKILFCVVFPQKWKKKYIKCNIASICIVYPHSIFSFQIFLFRFHK